MGAEEEAAALRVLRSGWLAQQLEVQSFEHEFCNFLGLPLGHAVAVSSGSAAIFLALWALGAQNKTVALPVYVCAALRNAIKLAGASIQLLDVEQQSPNISLDKIRDSQTDLVLLPHMFGLPVDLTSLNDKHHIIEDCAQSLGARVRGVPTGLQAAVGVYSFYATKLMTSGGQGGMLVSTDRNLIDMVRDYREFDCRADSKERFNFQMTELQAAVGRAQLAKLPFFLARRSEIFGRYVEAKLNLMGAENVATLSPVRYRAVLNSDNPQQIIGALEKRGIKAIVPIKDWELLGEAPLFRNAKKLTETTVSLPLYPALTDEEVETIIKEALAV